MRLEQVDFGDLNDKQMLQTATGIYECRSSAVRFVVCKHRELSIAWSFLHARRAEEKVRRVRTTAHLALQPDFGVFLQPLWLVVGRSWQHG